MANSPVQVVLNANNFVGTRPTNRGGSITDFFAGHDRDFVEHRRKINRQLAGVSDQLEDNLFGGMGFAKLRLQRAALAKSHRPTQALFTPNVAPVVASDGVGELIVEVTPEALRTVRGAVENTEDICRLEENKKTGKMEYHPTRRRSEVGAIDQIELWSAADRRTFSARDAVAWLEDVRTGGAYRVELFELPSVASEWDALPERKRQLFVTFERGLKEIGPGISADVVEAHNTGRRLMRIRLERSNATSVRFSETPTSKTRPRLPPADLSLTNHERLLTFLDSHPLVRSVELPPRLHQSIVSAQPPQPPSPAPFVVPARGKGPYPLVGVIDGGVGNPLSPWIVDQWELLADEDLDHDHGTFIGGLLVAGRSANPSGAVPEPDGCTLVDVAIFPADGSFQDYYNGPHEFFNEMEAAIAELRQKHGVRIFNLSINAMRAVSLSRYSVEASRLDAIAQKYDVVIVISAGNLVPHEFRAEWVADHNQALANLANARDDGILIPAESARNVSVSALNPPGHQICLPFAPSAYSRRGPGLRTGVKPDVAHVGGAAALDPNCGHGLVSCRPDGSCVTDMGTSYAAPQVAKTMALLDASIEGDVSRETLIALLLHRCSMPEPLRAKALRSVSRDLVGFGLPSTAQEILYRGDDEITLVFSSRLTAGKELTFPFPWPACLVNSNGSCRGDVHLTLVSTPPLDSAYGAELVRVNIHASLQQEHDSGWKSRVARADLPPGVESGSSEADLIEHALKWSATKVYHSTMPQGVGTSSNWRLHVSYLTRAADQPMPRDGVPFTMIMTIADPDRSGQPVFNDMRQTLRAIGVGLSDIQTAARVVSRV